MEKKEIYFDNAATTKPLPEAVSAAQEMLTENWGNPSSGHRRGFAAEKAVRQAREQAAAALGCNPQQLFFTSGGTEGDNFALFSVADRHGKRGKHIITTAVEHHAVLNAAKALAQRGFEVTYIPPKSDGSVSPEDIAAALRPDTILVSCMMVNSETGAVNDVKAMAALVHEKSSALFHTDAVQGFLKVPFHAPALGVDILTVSAHKIGGIKGCGAVYLREGLHLPPVQYGGGQEKGMRSGTENVPGIAAFGAAAEHRAKNLPEDLWHMQALRDRLLSGLPEAAPDAVTLGAAAAPHIVSFSVPGVRSQGLIGALDAEGFSVSAGSACSRGHRSHVLEAMGLPPAVMDGAVRVSFCPENTEAEVDTFLAALPGILSRLQGRRKR